MWAGCVYIEKLAADSVSSNKKVKNCLKGNGAFEIDKQGS